MRVHGRGGARRGLPAVVPAVLVAAAWLWTASLAAHHSFSAFYFEEQMVSVEGDVVEFEYRAPHAWVHLVVVEPDGRAVRYSAEWSNPRRLASDGVSKDTLAAGDYVRVTGSPGRDAREHRIHLKRIERPADGWAWGSRR